MLPPAEPSVLAANPKFSALYDDLLKNKLNADGTSKIQDANLLREREEHAESLRKARVDIARRELLVLGLKELSYDDSELPEDLRELVAVVAAVLEGQVADEDRDLLCEDVAKFKANITTIARALSARFGDDVASIATLLDPDDPPSSPDLVPSVSDLKASISDSQTQLDATRLRLATETVKVRDLQLQIMHQSIAILEQTIHGSVSRASKAKAEYLATVAEGMSKKLSLQQKQLDAQIYPPDVQKALRAKAEEVEANTKATKRKIREAEERLEGYRGVQGIEGVAGEYAEVLAETERVKDEIARLRAG